MRLDNRTILIVDDQQPLRKFIATILSNRGYRLLEAASGHEAIDIVGQERIDLLISDVVMPGITGPELAATLGEGGAVRRFLLISGGMRESLQGARGGGALPFLKKPFTPRALLEKVTALLEDNEVF